MVLAGSGAVEPSLNGSENKPFSDLGIPNGGGKPKKASNHPIIADPSFGPQIV
jgi:hypothetical protein